MPEKKEALVNGGVAVGVNSSGLIVLPCGNIHNISKTHTYKNGKWVKKETKQQVPEPLVHTKKEQNRRKEKWQTQSK